MAHIQTVKSNQKQKTSGFPLERNHDKCTNVEPVIFTTPGSDALAHIFNAGVVFVGSHL